MNRATFAIVLALAFVGFQGAGQAQGKSEHWLSAWATAVTWRPAAVAPPRNAPPVTPQTLDAANPAAVPAPPAGAPAPIQFANQTLRQIVHLTMGGQRLRVRFDNSFGTAPLEIGAANVAVRSAEAAIVPSSSRALRFSGQPSATLPAGAAIVSDSVDIIVPAFGDLAIDLFLPGDTSTWPSPLTVHGSAFQTNYVSGPGNHAGEPSMTAVATTASWFLLSRVEVVAPERAAAIVTIGDSITDGTRSTPNTNRRWPNELARRLKADSRTRDLSVVNAGISGNRLISELTPAMGINLLARFDRDVIAQPGVKFVVVLEGINDIGMRGQSAGPSAAQLIAAHQQVIERAHAHGLKIFGATLTPFEGAAYFTPEGEAKRQAVNEWIRTSKWYDGVIDFDKATRDPASPTKLLPAYNSGDSLHPSDAGYKAMADAIDLGLFK